MGTELEGVKIHLVTVFGVTKYRAAVIWSGRGVVDEAFIVSKTCDSVEEALCNVLHQSSAMLNTVTEGRIMAGQLSRGKLMVKYAQTGECERAKL